MATITYKCPSCGAGLSFDPESQNFKCEYCLNEFTQEQLQSSEADESGDKQVADQEKTDQTVVQYTCPSCGAEVVTDETTASTFCYFCHNPVVLAGKLSGEFTPDYVIPFQFDKDRAVGQLKQWIGNKKYVPSSFYSTNQIEKMSAVYFPYLIYSCQVEGEMEADAANVRIWRGGNIEYTETKQFEVVRQGKMEVKHVTRNALKKANRQLVEGVLPFPMEEMKPFHTSYLSGFLAEKRDMDQSQFQQEVEEEVLSYAESQLRDSIGTYESVRVKSHKEEIKSSQWKYALMPVWVMTYHHKQDSKLYYFAMNGYTGKICGVLPVSYKKLGILFVSIFIPLFLLFLIGGYFI